MAKIKKLIILTFILVFSYLSVGFINHNISKPNTPNTPCINLITAPSTTATIPTSFDLRDQIAIGVENQNPYGICYAFASLTSLETYLALTYGEYYDFSELHFAVSLYAQDGYYSSVSQALNSGGNFSQFALYTQKDKSLVLEDEMPMNKYLNLNVSQRYTAMTTDFNNINDNFYSLVKVNDTKSFPQYVGNKAEYSSAELSSFRNDVKNHIMQYGSVTAGIYTNNSFNNNTVNYKITDDRLIGDKSTNTINSVINHLISIVGWDDTYDANGAWENPGAYLCLNSWGESFGDDGYFYVSYDDYFIEYTIQGIVNATLSTTNNKISTISTHQHQSFVITHSLDSEQLFIANIIDVSQYLNQSIQYIDNFVRSSSADFYIKFFQNKNTALSGLNSVTVMDLKASTKVGDYSIYGKYRLNTPCLVSNNYMVVISKVKNVTKTYSLGTKNTNNEWDHTYYSTSGLGSFDLNKYEYIWNPPVANMETKVILPIILHTTQPYVEISSFSSSTESFITSTYIKNNAIFYGKSINLNINNLDDIILSNIKITKLYTNSFTDVTANFETTNNNSTLSIKMINELSGNFIAGNYLVSIPVSNGLTIYRIIEVQNVVTYPITYELNGGVANNPAVYTNKHSSLVLSSPIKSGYTFVGWYINSSLTIPFDTTDLPYTSLTLYAKYDFATPTLTSKTKDIVTTYYDGIKVDIMVDATHSLLNEYNTLGYQWYMRKTLNDDYIMVDGAINKNLSLYNVSESGYYACAISIVIKDPSLTEYTYIQTLVPSEHTEIFVNIKPYIYDMSKAIWNYNEALAYDTTMHTVEVINLPAGVTVNYTNNQASEIGSYIAHAELIYDTMNDNAIANPIEDLNWEIRKSKISITINDIVTPEQIDVDALTAMYSCVIESEYLPADIVTLQDKLEYLELVYILQDTAQPYIKTITATTKSFDIHEIIIVNGYYRITVSTLTDNNITVVNSNGFVKDCEFSANTVNIDKSTKQLLESKHLNLIECYSLSYSYLASGDQVKVHIPIAQNKLFNKLSVYILKDGKLTLVEKADINIDGINFTSTEQNATYLIVEADNNYTSNTQFIILICIVGIFIATYMYTIVTHIKKKNRY